MSKPSKVHMPPKDGMRSEPSRLHAYDEHLVYWIGQVTGKGSAVILSPLIRTDLEALYEKHRVSIDRLKKVRTEEQEIKGEAATDRGDDPPPAGKQRRPGK